MPLAEPEKAFSCSYAREREQSEEDDTPRPNHEQPRGDTENDANRGRQGITIQDRAMHDSRKDQHNKWQERQSEKEGSLRQIEAAAVSLLRRRFPWAQAR